MGKRPQTKSLRRWPAARLAPCSRAEFPEASGLSPLLFGGEPAYPIGCAYSPYFCFSPPSSSPSRAAIKAASLFRPVSSARPE